MRVTSFFAGALLVGPVFLHAAGELSGRRAPGFSLLDLSFRQHDLQDYRGKVVLIDLMQTACPHCRVFSRILEEVKARYGDRIVVLSVVNPPDNPATMARYVEENKITTPLLLDCGNMAASYMKWTPQNPAFDVPHLFIVDGEGMIRNDFGYSAKTKDIFEGRALFKELDRLLEGQPPPKKKK